MGGAFQERRRIVLLGAAATLAGCTVPAGGPGGTDSGRSTTGTTPPGDCSLKHNVLNKDRNHQIADRYEFDELSSTARQYFRGALEDPDSDFEVERTDRPAAEFEYTDVVSKYEIVYEGTVYVLGTWSGAGCRVDG